MSDVSRYDGDRGARPGPAVPAGLTALLALLEGRPDFWDRPEGDWGAPLPDGDATAGCKEARSHANSCYRLGSKALRRGELRAAAAWLGEAAAQEHPGAVFRLAVVVHRQCGAEERQAVALLVAEAAELGHGDAQALVRDLREVREAREDRRVREDRRGQEAQEPREAQDPEFVEELRACLTGAPSGVASNVTDSPVPTPSAGPPACPDELPAPDDPSAHPTPEGAPLTADHGGDAPGADLPGRSALWSPGPLRPPRLTVASRQLPGRSPAPGQWRAVERALRILHVLHGSTVALSPAELAKSTSLPKQVLEQLLHWLCRHDLAEYLADGGYIPGPTLLALSRREGGQAEHAMQQTLAALRDAVRAAVYVSSYTDGEVAISRFADGPEAPRVYEWVDFKASAHATAVGKSLLAQLSFSERMDHLSRHRIARFTSRTITDYRALFRDIDGRGPHAPQFDLREYSINEVCVAIPLRLGGQAECLALSLPVAQQHRLREAVHTLTGRSTAVLLSLLLAGDPPIERTTTAQSDIAVVPPSSVLLSASAPVAAPPAAAGPEPQPTTAADRAPEETGPGGGATEEASEAPDGERASPAGGAVPVAIDGTWVPMRPLAECV
ncbi:IclR family transcriptional regulator domain-containing protein [Streptomyces sp. URMC 123]|uniref:IclR family transcriptional regulator n=1 Tax=Streptomyces sp. URMC 123 TaxID=3423403 RepID=UPI003F1D7CF9